MKKVLAMAAAAALACGASAFAATPFSAVSTSDWAYQAISQLSDQGMVAGYPDGTFKGQQNITRYEAAQIVARLLAREDQLNAEQKATVNKLAAEYADELENLGVRVTNLEKKVGNISWSGDARMQWQGFGNKYKDNYAKTDTYAARLRIQADAAVNDKITVSGRFRTDMDFVNDTNSDGQQDTNTHMDRLHVIYAPSKKTSIDVGRQELWIGQTGLLYDDTADLVRASYNTDKFGLEAGYGRLKAMYDIATDFWTENSSNNRESWYVQAKGHAGPVALNAFYLAFTQKFEPDVYISGDKTAKLWGVGAAFTLNKFVVDGDYITNQMKGNYNTQDLIINDLKYTPRNASQKINKPKLWTAGLTYGAADDSKPGTFSLALHYVRADKGSYFGSSTLDLTNQLEESWDNGAKFWVARGAVAVAKNVELDAYYNFNAKDMSGNSLNDSYGAEFNFYF